ncbi:signal recognition particle 19 kDa protein isoform X4 [Macaca fascicularis]|uniref:signal recognition particle 19 kDa protein isoform X4 n=1 Tax=Macaca fascicularis TaxID=9541 RepID=UPI0003ABB7BF
MACAAARSPADQDSLWNGLADPARPGRAPRVSLAADFCENPAAATRLFAGLLKFLPFICIYPAYLNNKKTIAEGRRIPISKAVENPTATEIQDVCSAVGLNVFLEKNKMYSREWNRDVQYRGRVRVQLKQEDGSLCLVQFPSHYTLSLTSGS